MYLAGIVILAAGITMNTKTMLGISPVISVAYAVSELTGIRLGIVTFFYYNLLILVQFLLLGREFDHFQWLQIAASFLTSGCISLYDMLLPVPASLPGRAVLLLAAIVVTGIGAILTIGARIVPNPADGAANAIAVRTGLSLGLSKNILDLSCVMIALVLGLVFRGRVIGIGVGTAAAMLLTGRVIALLQRPLMKLTGLDRASADAPPEERPDGEK